LRHERIGSAEAEGEPNRDIASEILSEDPHLELEKNPPILKHLRFLNRNKPNWSLIS